MANQNFAKMVDFRSAGHILLYELLWYLKFFFLNLIVSDQF